MEINCVELQEKIENGEKIIVDFWAKFCGPCKLMKPIFENVADGNSTEVQLYTMDVEENRDYAISLGIRNVPTIKSFKDGQEFTNKIGAMNEDEIKTLINIVNG